MFTSGKYYAALLMQGVIAFTISFASFAQAFNYKIFTPADGLPEGAVNVLFKDSYGYMWIGSCAGLTRYDGKAFTNYGLEDGLPSLCNGISFEDNEHHLWGTSGISVIKFTGRSFDVFPFNAADSITYIFSLVQTNENRIHANTTNGVFELNGTRWKKISIMPNPPQKNVRQILPLGNGSALINYLYTIILKKADGTTQVVADTSQCQYYTTILSYKNNALIIGSNRLFIYDEKGLHAIYNEIIKGQRIFSSMVDAGNRIWISAQDEGVIIFDKDSVQHFSVKDGLPNPLNLGFCEDGESNIWLGNFKGLIRLKQSFIEQFGTENGLASPDTRSIFIDHEGNIFFGHPGVGFSYWSQKKKNSNGLLFEKVLYKSKNIITAFSEDEKNRIWFTTYGGELFRYKNKNLEDISSLIDDKEASLLSVKFNSGDSCIYVLSDSAIFRIKDDVVKEKMRVLINNRIAEPQTLYFDRNNNLWLSALSGEFGIFDVPQNFFYTSSLHLNPASVRQILDDDAGNIWIATLGKGVIKIAYDSKKHITGNLSLTKKDGLTNNTVQSIAFDSTGKLWVLCSNGITRFDLSRKNSDGHFLYESFTVEDGISAKSFTDGNLLVDKQNNVWLSTSDGVFRFNNKKIITDTLPPKMRIENVVLVNDTSGWENYTKKFSYYFHLPLNPVLPYNKNNITVYYNGIAFTNNNEVEYAYRLDGLDTNWSNTTSNAYASFTNLSPGNYIFRVRARRKNYAWSNEATFAFIISPPFWETWWFRTFEIIAASALLIFVFSIRIKQVRKKALLQQQMQELEMKALKAQMNPHFIYNAMNSIQSLVMNDKPEEAVRYLGKFAKLLRQVLDNSDKPMIPLEKELSALQLYIELEALRLHKDFDYKIKVADGISQEEEFVPPLVLQPYVENALWHGLSNKEDERKLLIKIDTDEKFLICKIVDNGIGRIKSAEIKSKTSSTISKGLNITERRLSLMNTENNIPVKIEDLYDEAGLATGTAVTIMIQRNSAD